MIFKPDGFLGNFWVESQGAENKTPVPCLVHFIDDLLALGSDYPNSVPVNRSRIKHLVIIPT
jgi:hypothetical protein